MTNLIELIYFLQELDAFFRDQDALEYNTGDIYLDPPGDEGELFYFGCRITDNGDGTADGVFPLTVSILGSSYWSGETKIIEGPLPGESSQICPVTNQGIEKASKAFECLRLKAEQRFPYMSISVGTEHHEEDGEVFQVPYALIFSPKEI